MIAWLGAFPLPTGSSTRRSASPWEAWRSPSDVIILASVLFGSDRFSERVFQLLN
ncbi:hypothetical protein ACIBIZ_17675 [Nonomuraea spiralis]|uniref:hypothetical protein n=1 Tax=Nonomuraea spiralis TaxID=46182 RepID=UPI003794CDD9